jgi:hypothetical protein
MQMHIRIMILAAMLLTTPLGAQPRDAYTPSDPARVGATDKPQLVEFYHPL